jgi:predicted nucleic acid-binding protein
MSQVFLDSNVVLYLLSADARKADKAEALLAQQPCISVQVLNEVTSVCRRKLGMPWPEVQDLLLAVKASCMVLPLTVDTHAQAVSIAQQHQLSFYDAHIVAAAIQSGASALMSEDMHEGLVVGPIKIQNPFAVH